MKVLITTDWYRPAVNGVVTSVRNLAEGLKLDAFLAPLPPAERSALRAKLGLGADDLALTVVGRLAKEKNVSELLAFLPAAPRNVKLLLVGDGPCRHELEAQARERGLTDRVLFAGMAAPERVADCYKAGDVFVSASRSETQGLTYLEAMASGLPLLCREDDCLKGVLSPGGKRLFVHDGGRVFRGGPGTAERRAPPAARHGGAGAGGGALFRGGLRPGRAGGL